MSQVCSKCSRVNPADAVYCYFDGALLQGHPSANGGPVNPGTALFANPFVFPTGQTCQNFDQLAMACQQNWDTARDLLKQGFLVGFFGGLGRADLAKAAQEAAQFPDHDRGLDQLLAKLPSKVLEDPKLKVEPSEVNLGIVPMGTDRSFDLHLDNKGMRLVYGTAVSDSKWLLIGDGPGQKEKIFQFGDEAAIPVHIRGQDLRAGPKPLVGQLFFESNAGQPITVKVRLEVPVKPFPEGVLSGAKSPREVAVKARENPQAAAALFESGAVAAWFKENGWIYPVQGPAGTGIGAVQQFFEALGLAKAPKVVIDKQSLALTGNIGQPVQATLKVETPEKRPVYAHATADENWLDVQQTTVEAKGRVVLIHVRVPAVPNRPGQTLTAKIRVAANGNQRFMLPVTLTVQGTGAGYAQPAYAEPMPVMAIPDNPHGTVGGSSPQAIVAGPPAGNSPPSVIPVDSGGGNAPFQFQPASAPPIAQPPNIQSRRPRRQQGNEPIPFFVHIVPLILLGFALLITVIVDLLSSGTSAPTAVGLLDEWPRISIFYDYPLKEYPAEVRKDLGHTMRFGLRTNAPGGVQGNNKKLTYDIFGQTNSTLVMIDGNVAAYGNKTEGVWANEPKNIGNYGTSKASTWFCKKIDFVQKIERIPGEPFLEPKGTKIRVSQKKVVTLSEDTYIRALDTCLVRYEIKNRDTKDRKVGLRIVLDTYIGDNDGVPFTVPGVGLVSDKMAFSGKNKIPDFLQALERPDLKDPGTVVQINLKIGEDWEAPNRVLLTLWPGWGKSGRQPSRKALNTWKVPLISIRKNAKNPDSALVLYWDPIDIPPGKTRKLGFTYGLGHVSSQTGELSLTASQNRKVGDEVTILARVSDPNVKTITLNLPSGLTLENGEKATKNVPPLPRGIVGRPREVSWRARATASGVHEIEASTDTGFTQKTRISIHGQGGIFGG